MSSIFEMFEMDADMETDGIWIDYGKYGKFLVARSGGANTRFAKVLEAKMRPHRRQLDSGRLGNDIAHKLMLETFVEAVLMGWEGVKDKTGNLISYTPANAMDLFTKLPELFNDLREQSASMTNFQTTEIEEDSGN